MITVTKANGEREEFSEEKVLNSIKRAGVPYELSNKVLSHIKNKLHENISTSEIYNHILEYLDHSESPYMKSKYSLKQSIMMLGPTGYPFEDFVAKILVSEGYTTQVRQILLGKCVSHEVDVIAQKNETRAMIEAKFHNNAGIRSDLHVALYTKARFDDVKDKYHLTEGWIITNTKATSDAIAYAHCTGMKIISWSYPEKGSLRDLIEEANLHPITILTTLSASQKINLLQNHVVICADVNKNPTLLDILYLSAQQRQRVISEVNFICKNEQSN